MAGMKPGTRDATTIRFESLRRIVNPVRMAAITSRTIADYVAKRRTEKRSKKGPIVSPATINKELRTIRAVFGKAHALGLSAAASRIRISKEPGRLPTYVTPETSPSNLRRWTSRHDPRRNSLPGGRLVARAPDDGIHDRMAHRFANVLRWRS